MDAENGVADGNPSGTDSGHINQEVALDTIAQAESTRSFFLAQTLESTKTVPVVSAKLPIDTSHVISTEPSDSEASGEISPDGDAPAEDGAGGSDELEPATPSVSLESTVIGSFEYRGITYAIEPGGESVAVVAADYAKLPTDFIEAQTIVLPSVTSPDNIDYYSVTRIADDAFASLTSEMVEEDKGITAITIPASVTTIEDDAFIGFDTLQYIIVSADNPNYSMYDGCLYDKPMTSLLLIPGGKRGQVRIASQAESIRPEAFSHCVYLTAFSADAACSIFSPENDSPYVNANGDPIEVIICSEGDENYVAPLQAEYLERISVDTAAEMKFEDFVEPSLRDGFIAGACGMTSLSCTDADQFTLDAISGTQEIALKLIASGEALFNVMSLFSDEPGRPDALSSEPTRSLALADGDRFYTVPNGIALYQTNCVKFPFWDSLESGAQAAESSTRENEIDVGPEGGITGNSYFQYSVEYGYFLYWAGWDGRGRGPYYLFYNTEERHYAHEIRIGGKNGTSYRNGAIPSTSSKIGGDVWVFGTPRQYTVGFDADHFGGQVKTGVDTEGANTFGSSLTIEKDAEKNADGVWEYPVNYPTVRAPRGFVFKGWVETKTPDSITSETPCYLPPEDKLSVRENADGSHDYEFDDSIRILLTKDTQYYAIFTIDVSWNAKSYGGRMADGSESTTTSVIVNTPAELPAVADMGAGWTFEGWIPKGATPPASGDPSYIKGTSNIPTITADMAAANADGAIEGYEGVWSVAVDWVMAANPPDGAAITGATSTSGIIYGSTVTCPTVETPASHHFARWTAVNNSHDQWSTAAADGTHTIKVLAPGRIEASWTPNEGVVKLDANGAGSDQDQFVWATWGDAMPLDRCADDAKQKPTVTLGQVSVPTREGYEFVGFWSTPYSESADNPQTLTFKDESGAVSVAPMQYYAVNDEGTLVQAPWPDDDRSSTAWWDVTDPKRQNADGQYVLYAHWKYRIYLNLNTFNSDNELVVKDRAATALTFGADAQDMSLVTDAEQTNTSHDAVTRTLGSYRLEGDDQGVAEQSRAVGECYIDVIDGSPLQLPTVSNRRGYESTSAWAIQGTTCGHVSGRIRLDSSNATADETGARVSAAQAAVEGGTFPTPRLDDGQAVGDRGSITLFADWDGKAKSYAVELRSTYPTLNEGITGFTIEEEGLRSQTVTVVYDGAIPLGGEGGIETDTTGKYSDTSFYTETNAPTNLTLQGFSTERSRVEATAAAGTTYVAGGSMGTLSTATARPSGIYAFREVNDGVTAADADAEGLKTVDGITYDTRNGNAIVLWGWWSYSDVQVVFDLQGGYIGNTAGNDIPADERTLSGVKAYDSLDAAHGFSVDGKAVGTVPTRTDQNGLGIYSFNGYWNTPYSENGAVAWTDSDGEGIGTNTGVDFFAKCYYIADPNDPTKVIPNPAVAQFGESQPTTTLYAHWTYTIGLNKQLNADGKSDIADAGLVVVKADNDQARLSETVPLARTIVVDGTEQSEYVDGFGNVYTTKMENTSNDPSNSDLERTTLTVRAVAGAPVLVPSAYDRFEYNERANDGTGGYIRSGYDRTTTWLVNFGDRASFVDYVGRDGANPVRGAAHATKLSDSWKVRGGGDATAYPVAVGASCDSKPLASDGGPLLTLYADWEDAKQTYWVELAFNYALDDGSVEYASDRYATNPKFQATYDEAMDDVTYGAGAELIGGGQVGERTAEVIEAEAASTATAKVFAEASDGSDGLYRNLDFGGIYAVKNGFKSNEDTTLPHGGAAYFGSDGTSAFPLRFVDGDDGEERTIGDDVILTNTAENPIMLYVFWKQPTRTVTFNLYDRDTAATIGPDGAVEHVSTVAETDFTLMKGDVLSSVATRGDMPAKLASLASELKAVTNKLASTVGGDGGTVPSEVEQGTRYGTYEFAGFWTHPYEEGAYRDEATGADGVSVCYFDMNEAEDALAPATATAADGWRPDDGRVAATWNEDSDTPLYAHWKYRIRFSSENDRIPTNAAVSDRLLIGSGDLSHADSLVSFGRETAKGSYNGGIDDVDALGRVTFGHGFTLPFSGSDATRILRIRDFNQVDADLTNGESYGFGNGAAGENLGYTGYAFNGWLQGSETEPSIGAGTDFAASPSAVMPVLAGDGTATATLHARWQARAYDLEFRANYAGSNWSGVYHEEKTPAGTAKVRVAYDQLIRDGEVELTGNTATSVGGTDPVQKAIPKSMWGYTFKGYFGGKNGTGMRYYAEPLASTGGAYADACDRHWFAPCIDETGAVAETVLYGDYERNGYTMTYEDRDPYDGTLQETSGHVVVEGKTSSAVDRDQEVWHYGDSLNGQASSQYPSSKVVAFPNACLPGATSTLSRTGYTFGGWYYYEDETALPQRSDFDSDDAFAAALEAERSYVYAYDQDAMTQGFPKAIWDKERGFTLYPKWEPIAYKVLFNPNFRDPSKSSIDHERTFRYEQVLTSADFPAIETDGKPWTFYGWNMAADAATDEADGWLYDRSDYATNASPSNPGNLMGLDGGRFMPANVDHSPAGRELRFYAVWQDFANKHVVLFGGGNGVLKDGGNRTVPSLVLEGALEYGNEFALNPVDSSRASIAANPGYRFDGWYEIQPSELGLSQWTDMDAAAIRALLTADRVAAINGEAARPWGSRVTGIDCMENNDPASASYQEYRDYYLVARYTEITDEYSLTLDLGSAAVYGGSISSNDWAPSAADGTVGDAVRYSRTLKVSDDAQGAFSLPVVKSAKYDLVGWVMTPGDGNGVSFAFDDQSYFGTPVDRAISILPSRFIAEAGTSTALKARTYTALWVEKSYAIIFDTDRYATKHDADGGTVFDENNLPEYELDDEGERIALENEAEVRTQVKHSNTFAVPYPATRGDGYAFREWRLARSNDALSSIGSFKPSDVCSMAALAGAIEGKKRYTENGNSFNATDIAFTASTVVSEEGDDGVWAVEHRDGSLRFKADWAKNISVTMPLQVRASVDYETGDMLAAESYIRSLWSEPDAALEVLSLRCDKLDAAGKSTYEGAGDYVFDATDGGADVASSTMANVFLSVYAGLDEKPDLHAGAYDQATGALQNVSVNGTLRSSYSPLLMNLAENSVITKKLADGAAGSVLGASLVDGTQTLDGNGGFVPFTNDRALPLYYGLVFDGVAPIDFLASLPERDTDDAVPIAKLYYTVGLK